jgi:hypothetical protein
MTADHAPIDAAGLARPGTRNEEPLADEGERPVRPPADDHELRRKWLETAAQIIVRSAAYIIITHWRSWGF